MVDLQIESLKKVLRSHLSEFTGDNSAWRYHPVYGALRVIRECGEPAFLCGGAVRDILLQGRQFAPRDIDIILARLPENKIESLLKTYKNRRTRFGGFSFEIQDWNIDIWPLLETWAFRKCLVNGACFFNFPKTTFLDIDAVAVELFTEKGRTRKIYSKGFFEAILNKTVDINFEENPYPSVCVVKSIATALRLNFKIGRRLAEYILRQSERIDAREITNIFQNKYKSINISLEKYNFYINVIKEELHVKNAGPIKIPLQNYRIEKSLYPSKRYFNKNRETHLLFK